MGAATVGEGVKEAASSGYTARAGFVSVFLSAGAVAELVGLRDSLNDRS